MQTQPITTETSTQSNGVEAVPCEDCGPETFNLKQFAEWPNHDLLAAILVELILIRKNFENIGAGLEQMSGSGIGKMMAGLFG